jgi:hypothetical protein
MATMREGVSDGLQILVDRLLAKAPEERYSGYPALLDDLSLLVT